MREVVSSLLGVPAAVCLAAGLGIVAVTLLSRVRRVEGRPPIRWAHLGLGVGITGLGAMLLWTDVALLGTG